MTQSEINDIFDATIKRSRDVLCSKADEYVGKGDRLSNFKHAANLQNLTLPAALGGMMCKHTVSVYDMIDRYQNGETFSEEKWDEKITDSLNYLILLQAVLVEEKKGKELPPPAPIPPPVRDKCIFCGVELSDSYVCLDCAKKTPKPAESAPAYREVKRMAEIGEWVKIVNEESAEGQYKNGDIGQIASPVRSGGPWTHIAINGISTEVYHSEYVVLEGYTG